MKLNVPVWAVPCLTCLSLSAPDVALADVVTNSHLSLNVRNLYLDRDFYNDHAADSRVGNWSQGLDLQFRSGYTDTPLAIGLDIDAQYALRLDARGNDGSLPYSTADQKAANDYARAGATLKVKYAKTEVRIGDQKPNYPVASNDPSRQLDTIYQGAVFESRDIDKLQLVGGRFWSIVTRQSSDHEKLYRYGTSDRLDSEGLDFLGGTYSLTPDLQISYFNGVLHDIYQQQYAGVKQRWDLGNNYALKTDLGYFDNSNDGSARSGNVGNRAYSALVSVEKSGHLVGLSYQRMLGETAFPTLNGYVPQPYLPNWAGLPFIRPQERSWSVRYVYDFSAAGVPGLRLFTRYIKGSDIDLGAGRADGQENERDIWVGYVLQSGALKGLSFDFKNINARQKYGNDYIENRLITSYTWNIW